MIALPAPDFFSQQILASRRFYLKLRQPESRQLFVVAGGYETCTANYLIQRTHFPYCAIEFVAGGEGWLELADQRHALSPGTLFAYDRTVPHRISSSPRPLRKYFLTFHGRSARRLLATAGLAPGTCRLASRPAHLQAAWEEVLELAGQPRPAAEEHAVLGLRFLLAIMGEPLQPSDASGRAEHTLRRCEAYLQQHYLEIQRLQEVADACHVDLSYLCRLSRRFRGQTLYQYLQRLQMSHAAERLQGDRLVREVADELNLDPFQFSRTFKRVHGISPAEFKRLYGSPAA